MQFFRSTLVLVCAGALLLLAACEDPSNVGLGVGGDLAGGEPVTVRLTPTTFESETFEDLSGNLSRVLVGDVQDPILGRMTARGYFDVVSPNLTPDAFPEGPIEYAELRLFPDYTYGDTLQSASFALNDMPSEWEGAGLTTDTTLTGGAFIRDFSLTPADSVVNVPLPEAWIMENSEVLRDTSDAFPDRFHGFQVVPNGGSAIVGLDAGRSQLRLVVDGDTTAFGVGETFSELSRDEGSASLPANRLLVQDGFGEGLAIDFTFPDSLRDRPVSRAELVLPTDTLSLLSEPNGNANFVRPTSTSFSLVPLLPSGEIASAFSPTYSSSEGTIIFRQGARQIFESELLGQPQVDQFRLILAPGTLTIAPALVYGPEAPAENVPQLILTVTSSDS